MTMEFSEWITQKYIEWRGNAIGNERSISQFAKEHIGVSQQLLNGWMQGLQKPSTRSLPKIAQHYPEVYEVLGLESPNSLQAHQLPPALRSNLQSALDEIDATIKAAGLSPESPEGMKIISETFSKFGFTITDIE